MFWNIKTLRTKDVLGILGIVLVPLIYFGFSTESHKAKQNQISRSLIAENLSQDKVLLESKKKLSNAQLQQVESLEQKLKQNPESIDVLEELAAIWYRLGSPGSSGIFAEKIATLNPNHESWSICGTTYFLCFKKENDQKLKSFCLQKSRSAFEKAISLNPDDVSSRVNLALTYVEMPPDDQPMKGVLMLRDLHEKYPDNPSILYHLAKLAMNTGQYDKAKERIEQALALDGDNKPTNCLAAEIYSALGQQEKAAIAASKCK